MYRSVTPLFEAIQSAFAATHAYQGGEGSWMDSMDKKYHHFSGEKYKILKQKEFPFFSLDLYPPAMKGKVCTVAFYTSYW